MLKNKSLNDSIDIDSIFGKFYFNIMEVLTECDIFVKKELYIIDNRWYNKK